MNRTEFATIMAYLAAGVGKEITEQAAEVYFDLLGDLPISALQAAAKQVLLENKFPVFPSIGALREAATKAMMGENPLPIQAWQMAIEATSKFWMNQKQEALASLPPLVAQTVEYFGWKSLYAIPEPEVARAQFTKAYESLVVRDKQQAILPASVKVLLENVARDARQREIDSRDADQVLLEKGKLPLDRLGLSRPALRKLTDAGFRTVGDLPKPPATNGSLIAR